MFSIEKHCYIFFTLQNGFFIFNRLRIFYHINLTNINDFIKLIIHVDTSGNFGDILEDNKNTFILKN